MTNDGGPAFPIRAGWDPELPMGMTLRDYFAAACLGHIVGTFTNSLTIQETEGIAKSAYAIADYMLAERAK